MHVGGLQLFSKPEDAGEHYGRAVYESMIDVENIGPLWRRRPRRSVATAGQWCWDETPPDEVDIQHHVRHSALPEPGRVRELLELCGRLHGTRLDYQRPLWEAHVIEGLNDGRLAAYFKMHHALVDGVSAMRLLQSVLTTDPDRRDVPPMWAAKPAIDTARAEREKAAKVERDLLEVPLSALRTAFGITAEAAGLPGALIKTLNKGARNQTAALSFHAPKSALNKKITAARRFAAEDWALERLKAVSSSTNTTLNDVVLAMCSGALRSYLTELNQLPDQTLIAMVPVSLKSRSGAADAGGNAIGNVMVKLGTDIADPADRLEAIHRSMKDGKEALGSMSSLQIIAMSALGMTPALLTPLLRLQGITRPPFNLIISNVPGPKEPLYLNGARLEGMYPLSIPMDGIALNITCNSYVDQMAFGLTGCRRTLPSLQRLLVHLEDELAALEKAADIS
jgi:diacylglycerol O-acyltransferase